MALSQLIQRIDKKIQFFRIAVALYSAILLFRLYPDLEALFSINGVAKDKIFSYTTIFFPFDISNLFTSINIKILILTSIIASLTLAIGCLQRILCLYLLITFFLLHYRNPYSMGFYTQFLGWSLLFLFIYPRSNEINEEGLKIRRLMIFGAQLILAMTYFSSGVGKALRPEWIHGDALLYFTDLPFLRNANWILLLPLPLIKISTWFALFTELLYLPLFLWKKTRIYAWLAATLLQFLIILAFDIPYVTSIILIFHFLAIDQEWFDRWTKRIH